MGLQTYPKSINIINSIGDMFFLKSILLYFAQWILFWIKRLISRTCSLLLLLVKQLCFPGNKRCSASFCNGTPKLYYNRYPGFQSIVQIFKMKTHFIIVILSSILVQFILICLFFRWCFAKFVPIRKFSSTWLIFSWK